MPKRWSTKDVDILRPPSEHEPGLATFRFTDDYSVFHYSKMPDRIPDKGEALGRMAAYTLRRLEQAGVPTHMVAFDPPRTMTVKFLRILDPARGELHPGDRARLVPLQVIYRNRLPPGASVFRRLAAKKVTLDELGLTGLPTPGATLKTPIIEFTTKLEEIDRFITHAEAQALAALSDAQVAEVKRLAHVINGVVNEIAQSRGLTYADGKVEFGIDGDGRVILVDTAGTADENRFTLDGVHVTKQILRDFYLARGLEADVQRWAAEGRPRSTWPTPEPLPGDLLSLVADMYRSLCELWTGETIWGAPPLYDLASKLRAWQLPAPQSATRPS
ncbi:phosphoribosylaminoimidazolesuccinocarboxamide synthase [Roseospira visakhapatnamensis]|uniref:Phosphoribosylaminoimidazole-succinocarboxamide synthase n=1 Tax=Roseospira visakhapatnamensis TaxID=390880 RepID=A0A7W6R9U8_9PROT|nr:phosphoribosylaminoimidazolesuccinocarboxamide synthase [Roseospira visakhapatnamensis]MBB4264579.1 phosphoribosylaminoimidazole-succinocarboxamide synthase [Roseospira visakhapatnamensis]